MKKTELCAYRYDPLDRLIGIKSNQQPDNLRFYCKSRLATEIKGNTHHAIMQHGDQLLAQNTYNATDQTNTLFATDLQRSVLCTVTDDEQLHNAYAPYGYTKLIRAHQVLSFNGERPELITGHYLLGNGYRAFNPILMRFNSPDSWSPFGKGGVNNYSYCKGNPTNRRDPSGHFSIISDTIMRVIGIARSFEGIANAASTTARTSRSAMTAYAAGTAGAVLAAASSALPSTLSRSVMTMTSAALGSVASTMGRRARREAENLLALEIHEQALDNAARHIPFRPHQYLDDPVALPPPSYEEVMGTAPPPSFSSLSPEIQRGPPPPYTPPTNMQRQTPHLNSRNLRNHSNPADSIRHS
ncbi:RHS repeat-associated core domain-containing protein [Pseudomonas endophytica]|uniref:RHS repeat-associated core domain-containing protein n=1 Tax=Pseudomonas endophytica TaxID=1563157 RepID=UPI0009ECB918|nr:RHS repeat-associated core domain-containing protein [Pseudomonas endophytica]